jgi:hypothetical protein
MLRNSLWSFPDVCAIVKDPVEPGRGWVLEVTVKYLKNNGEKIGPHIWSWSTNLFLVLMPHDFEQVHQKSQLLIKRQMGIIISSKLSATNIHRRWVAAAPLPSLPCWHPLKKFLLGFSIKGRTKTANIDGYYYKKIFAV